MKKQVCSTILEEAGVRVTSSRLLIYEAISEEKDTFSLGSLEEKLQSIDKSVIFRTLTLFREHRLIHSIDDGSGSVKYCLCHNYGHCQSEEAHCHFYCVIFRTLTLFREHRLIHSIDDGSGSVKYCLCHNYGHCQSEEAHCHFYCEVCGKTYCLSQDLIPKVPLPNGFMAKEASYILKGICARCSKLPQHASQIKENHTDKHQ